MTWHVIMWRDSLIAEGVLEAVCQVGVQVGEFHLILVRGLHSRPPFCGQEAEAGSDQVRSEMHTWRSDRSSSWQLTASSK